MGGRERESVNLKADVRLSPASVAAAQQDLLVDGLEELALVFPHLGVINLLHQLGVFVDEPCFPEYIGSCVLHLRSEKAEPSNQAHSSKC